MFLVAVNNNSEVFLYKIYASYVNSPANDCTQLNGYGIVHAGLAGSEAFMIVVPGLLNGVSQFRLFKFEWLE